MIIQILHIDTATQGQKKTMNLESRIPLPITTHGRN